MRYSLLILFLIFSFCKNGQTPKTQLLVYAAQTSLRAEPSEKSREITVLHKGQALTDLGEVGPSETQIAVGEELFQTPWIKVQTAENQSGWVLALAVRPVQDPDDWLLQKRLACYFGEALASRRNALCNTFFNLEREGQLADTWRDAIVLRDTFLQMLLRRSETGFQPDFNWLNVALPGFLYQRLGESGRPYLFADFAAWQQKALKTNGLQDDIFFESCFVAFSRDSIESFFPSWNFQLSESESASQLGIGQHLKMLQQIDLAMETGPLFAPPLETFKERVLEDIFGKNVHYWQPQEKILVELEQILAHPPKCLNAREREALGIRRKMFEDPVGNGIVVNLRSGG